MIATNADDIKNLRAAGQILGGVLRDLEKLVADGVTTAELDLAAGRMITERGAVAAFYGYKPEGAAFPYPAVLCTCVNEAVAHGIPSEKQFLRTGDIITLDLGLSYNGFFADAARTVAVGEIDADSQKLLTATKLSLDEAIDAARIGNRVGNIGAAIYNVAHKYPYNFAIVEELGGHGIGKVPHEEPFIPNDGRPGTGEPLLDGMVIAIEPMLCLGKGAIVLTGDQWTLRMRDRKRAACFEETILITKDGPEILTRV
jgi:methionyl aminopeptidase